MKLITETLYESLEVITEGKDKTLYIRGPFAVSEAINGNRRKYGKSVMESAVSKYVADYVSKNRALGEMNHPDRLTVDPERACMLISELTWEGDIVMGKAKVLSTPMGDVLRGLIESGVNIGVSTRGAGSVIQREGYSEVDKDFMLTAVDAVFNPSGPGCFVQGIMEGVDWIYEGGIWKQQQLEQAKRVVESTPARRLPEVEVALFEQFLKSIK